MGMLDELLAGGQLQKEYRDFVNRYEQGHPSQGYSDQEVLKRYGEVSHAVPPDQYAQAAREALGKLSPEERAEFLKMLQERAAARGVKLPGKVASDPKDLGKVLTDLHEKPGRLRDILVPDIGGNLDQRRPWPAVSGLRKGAPHRLAQVTWHDERLAPLGDAAVVEIGAEVGEHVGEVARIAARDADQRHAL